MQQLPLEIIVALTPYLAGRGRIADLYDDDGDDDGDGVGDGDAGARGRPGLSESHRSRARDIVHLSRVSPPVIAEISKTRRFRPLLISLATRCLCIGGSLLRAKLRLILQGGTGAGGEAGRFLDDEDGDGDDEAEDTWPVNVNYLELLSHAVANRVCKNCLSQGGKNGHAYLTAPSSLSSTTAGKARPCICCCDDEENEEACELQPACDGCETRLCNDCHRALSSPCPTCGAVMCAGCFPTNVRCRICRRIACVGCSLVDEKVVAVCDFVCKECDDARRGGGYDFSAWM